MKAVKFLFAFLLGIALILLPVFPLTAQTTSPFYWDFINIDMEVQENGDLLVTETQKYVFTASHTNQRYRYIPIDGIEQITDIAVFEGDRQIPSTTGIDNNQQWIQWQHELKPPDTHTFVLKYRVVGGLQVDSQNTQVYWKAIFADRQAPVNAAKVTVKLPEVLSGKVLSFQNYGVSAIDRQLNPTTFEFVADKAVQPGEELEVKVTFTSEILKVDRAYSGALSDRKLKFPSTLVWLLGMCVLHWFAWKHSTRLYKGSTWVDRRTVPSQPPRLDIYEVACLAGGSTRVVSVAISNLMKAGQLVFVEETGNFLAQGDPKNCDEFEKLVMASSQYGRRQSVLQCEMDGKNKSLLSRLQKLKLAVSAEQIKMANSAAYIWLTVMLVGVVWRILIQASAPYYWLVILLDLGFLFSMTLNKNSTTYGDEILEKLRQQHTSGFSAMRVALYGSSVFVGSEREDIHTALSWTPPNDKSGSSDGGGGGGGDGGGGGGGDGGGGGGDGGGGGG